MDKYLNSGNNTNLSIKGLMMLIQDSELYLNDSKIKKQELTDYL